MRFFSLFRKKPPVASVPELFTDDDFDRLFNVVFINGVNDKFAEVYLKTDKSYETHPKILHVKKEDVIVLPFSRGVEEFCINRSLPVIMNSKVDLRLVKYFLNYLKLKGVSDELVDAFEMCWYPGRDLPPNKPVYDESGKRIGYKPR